MNKIIKVVLLAALLAIPFSFAGFASADIDPEIFRFQS